MNLEKIILDYIVINGIKIEYKIIRMVRKTLALNLEKDGIIIAKAPRSLSKHIILDFMDSKRSWILEQYTKRKDSRSRHVDFVVGETISYIGGELRIDNIEQARIFLKKQARLEINKRVAYYSVIMGVSYHKIAIREQKTRWGSCSSKGNLNFNWKLILMPEYILNYVIIHELAHLIEMNHSQRFWNQVENFCPLYKDCIKWLRQNGANYL